MAPPEFNFSRFLFLHDDGNPISFYMRPCCERQRLRPLIEHGGGKVSLKVTTNTVKLIDSHGAISSDDCISSKFIEDSIQANTLLDMDKYKVHPRPYLLRQKSTERPEKSPAKNGHNQAYSSPAKNGRNQAYSSDSELDEDDLEPADYIVKSIVVDRKGRMKYTLEEDRLIIEHLISTNRYGEAKGIAVWMCMEKEKVTSHTGQSMYTRYKKIILPNIGSYHIPRDWVARLTGNMQAVQVSDDETQQEDVNFEKTATRTPRSQNSEKTSSADSDDHDEFDKNLINAAKHAEVNKFNLDSQNDFVSSPKRLLRTRKKDISSVPEQTCFKSTGSKNSEEDTHLLTESNCETSENNPKQVQTRKRNISPQKETVSTKKTLSDSIDKSANSGNIMAGDVSGKKQNSPKKVAVTNLKHGLSHSGKTVAVLSPRRRQVSQDDIQQGKRTPSPRKQIKGNERENVHPALKDRPLSQKKKRKATNAQQQSAGLESSDEDKDHSSVHKPRVDYVMDVDDVDSQPASQSQESTLTDNELDNIDPQELKKCCTLVKKYCSEFNLSPAEFIHCLWANNGVVEDAVHWIKYGTNRDGCPAWEPEDEEDLIANKDMDRLQAKFGLRGVSEHALMLEDD